MDLAKLKQFVPIGSRVVLKAHRARQAHAGLVLPEDTLVFSPVATVIAVGPDCKQVKEGDVVAIDPGTALNLLHLPTNETEKHLFCVCEEAKILAILDPSCYAAQPVAEDGSDGFLNQPLGRMAR